MDLVPVQQPVYNITSLTQKITYTATVAQSNPVAANQILLVSTTDCHVTFDGTTAVGTSFFLPAKIFIAVNVHNPNAAVSVVQDASGGSLYITGIN